MRLVVPIAAPEEVAPLSRAGADEFYCGLVPPAWAQRFGRSTLNRRMGGNLPSVEDLARTVDSVHALGKTVSVAFNAQSYPADRWDELLKVIERVAALGADALIVGELGVLAALAAQRLPLRLHLSSVASCHNSEMAQLAAELGAVRVILPRHVTLREIRGMCRAIPGTQVEVFLLNDGCVFEEGSCHTLHLPGALGGPICLERFQSQYRRRDGQALAETDCEALRANEEAWDRWLWHVFACGFSVTTEGLPHGPCGLCAISQLGRAGVAAVKIAGRDSRLERRLKSVEMARAVLDRAATGDERQVQEFARALRGKPDRCACGFMCYYREVSPSLNG